ncbi:glycosyltransferase [Halomicronema hongdechloris]|uniref:glycosyltransferase n=1 Tax=Halomicronema hongdechloris TaxID=1209493 RepID=UPI001650FFBB|nr:glycosyltransferase [Halomicronema hongdechloris]
MALGSAPEIIADGKTGYLCQSVDDCVQALTQIDRLDRRDCRDHVETHFSVQRMVDGYEAVYRQVLSKRFACNGHLQAPVIPLGTTVFLCNSDRASKAAQELLWTALSHYHAGHQAAGSPDWRCLLLGDPTTPRHARQLKPLQLGRRISVVPPCQEHLAYGAADVCWIPDPYKPLGTLALKALDHGLPVIAANTGAYRFTIVPGETGWLVPPGDAAAMAQASMALLSRPWRPGHRRPLALAAMADGQWQWYRTAAYLSDYYRQHLARLVGAAGLVIPHQVALPVPDAVWADRRLAAAAATMAIDQPLGAVASVSSRYGWSA